MGDYNGIGPEVALKSFQNRKFGNHTPLLLGHESVWRFYASRLDLNFDFNVVAGALDADPNKINILNTSVKKLVSLNPGSINPDAGRCSMEAVQKGIELCMDQTCDALVTAPISKESIQKAGYNVPGHTEFLAEKTATSDYMMILASGDLRVGLITGHIPLKEVAGSLRKEQIIRQIDTLNQSLKRDFGIPKPRIAIFGLNPHAGDGGVLGMEEIDIIAPAIQASVARGINAEGPLPADGFFGSKLQEKFDGILAMYHDQGLVPFKALTFGSGVNFTAGLPIIRTSPDHGTAFGIAGRNIADERSFDTAYQLACEMADNRKRVST